MSTKNSNNSHRRFHQSALEILFKQERPRLRACFKRSIVGASRPKRDFRSPVAEKIVSLSSSSLRISNPCSYAARMLAFPEDCDRYYVHHRTKLSIPTDSSSISVGVSRTFSWRRRTPSWSFFRISRFDIICTIVASQRC